jgi:hypothetical protein
MNGVLHTGEEVGLNFLSATYHVEKLVLSCPSPACDLEQGRLALSVQCTVYMVPNQRGSSPDQPTKQPTKPAANQRPKKTNSASATTDCRLIALVSITTTTDSRLKTQD